MLIFLTLYLKTYSLTITFLLLKTITYSITLLTLSNTILYNLTKRLFTKLLLLYLNRIEKNPFYDIMYIHKEIT